MTRRTPFLLTLVLVIAGGFVWFGDSTAPETDVSEQEVPDSEPGANLPVDVPRGAELPEAALFETRVGVSAGEDADDEASEASLATPGLSEHVVWIEGRVVFPPGTPAGGSTVVCGRRSSSARARERAPIRSNEVGADGSFLLAYPSGEGVGRLRLDSDYLYLPRDVELDLGNLPERVVLEPRLGARVRGRVLLPLGAPLQGPGLEGARVWARTTSAVLADANRRGKTTFLYPSSSRAFNRGDGVSVDLEPSGAFVVKALPVEDSYELAAKSPLFADAKLSDLEVRAGQTLEVELSLGLGARVEGRLMDATGDGFGGAYLELTLTSQLDGSSMRHRFEVDADGHFDVQGLPSGHGRLIARVDDFVELITDLGQVAEGEQRVGLELVPLLGSSVSGLVVYSDMTPVHGAFLHLWQDPPKGSVDRTTREFLATTNEHGRFHVEGFHDGPVVILATKNRRRDAVEEGGASRRRLTSRVEGVKPGGGDVQVLLESGHSVRGRVVDDLGDPVETFSVEARRSEPAAGRAKERVYPRAFQDEKGEFVYTGLTSGRWRMSAKTRSYASHQWIEVLVPTETPVDLVLPRAATLRGEVRTPTGELAAGAAVQFAHMASSTARASGRTVNCDDQGRFEFSEVTPGRLQLSSTGFGWSRSAPLSLNLQPGEEIQNLVLSLRAPARISGEVHRGALPIAERLIVCKRGPHVLQSRSDSTGRFEFADLEPGHYSILLQAASTEGQPREAISDERNVELPEGGEVHVVLGAPPTDPHLVRGRATLSGEPAVEFAVACQRGDFRAGTATDDAGRFELVIDGPGLYLFKFSRGEGTYRFEREVRTSSGEQVDVEIPAGTIVGRLVDSDGEPAANVPVSITSTAMDSRGRSTVRQEVHSNGEGDFELTFLPLGSYSIRAGGLGWTGEFPVNHAITVVEGLTLEIDRVLPPVRLQLEAGATIEGRVVDAHGEPAAGARVFVRDSQGRELSTDGLAVTDESGSFSCAGIPAGRFTVRVEMDGQSGESSANAGSTGLRIVLSASPR